MKVVEQILEEKLILLGGFDEEITKICSVDHIEEEIEVAVEIRLRIQQTNSPWAKWLFITNRRDKGYHISN